MNALPSLPPLPENPRVLVVALRRLGDVLFTTPLIASIRSAWPRAVIHALVFEETAGILAGNPDLDSIVTMPTRKNIAQGTALALRLFRRYDLAVSTQSGDRPTTFALIAGRRSVGPVDGGRRGALRRLVLSRSIAPQAGLHRLEQMLRVADALGIARVSQLVCPRGGASLPSPFPSASGGLSSQRREATNADGRTSACSSIVELGEPYAVIHAAPMFIYKRWTRIGWRAVATGLRDRGLKVVVTGGPDAAERAFLDDVWDNLPDIIRLDGRLSWPQLTNVLERACAYVGPDTAVTHLATASGCPTVALFGPTDPRLWGPVPAGGLDPMWDPAGTIQRRGNVWLVQNPLPCLPCHGEGCDRNIASRSQCLDQLSAAQVLHAVDEALTARPAAPTASPPASAERQAGAGN